MIGDLFMESSHEECLPETQSTQPWECQGVEQHFRPGEGQTQRPEAGESLAYGQQQEGKCSWNRVSKDTK